MKRVFETMFLCGRDAKAKDEDKDVVEVVRPVPNWVAQLLARHPRPENITILPHTGFRITPEEDLRDEKPKRRHKTKSQGPTKPPVNCRDKLLRVAGWAAKEMETLEIKKLDNDKNQRIWRF